MNRQNQMVGSWRPSLEDSMITHAMLRKNKFGRLLLFYATPFNSRCKRTVHNLFSKYVAKER